MIKLRYSPSQPFCIWCRCYLCIWFAPHVRESERERDKSAKKWHTGNHIYHLTWPFGFFLSFEVHTFYVLQKIECEIVEQKTIIIHYFVYIYLLYVYGLDSFSVSSFLRWLLVLSRKKKERKSAISLHFSQLARHQWWRPCSSFPSVVRLQCILMLYLQRV